MGCCENNPSALGCGHFAHRLIDHIYAAALLPDSWSEFVLELAEAFDSAAVLLTLVVPGDAPRYYGAGLLEDFFETHAEFLIKGLPWSSSLARNRVDEFGDGRDAFPDIKLRETGFYTGWMKPQKLAPVWPIGLTLTTQNGLAVGGLSIFRPEPGRRFTPEDLGLGDLLIPHLKRAFTLSDAVNQIERARLALAGVVDRFPTGVILLDERRRPVVTNTSADRIVSLNDGFKLSPSGPWVANPRENATLQKLLADALEVTPGRELLATGFMAVSRPSGDRSYPMMVTPLLADCAAPGPSQAVVAIFIANPDADQIPATDGLEVLYSLTHAEAELVRLLSHGLSLEEVARARDVSINTARSHLQHVFVKTHTRRQGDLLRLVLTGVAAILETPAHRRDANPASR